VQPEGVLKGLDFGFLHLLYLASHKLYVLSVFLGLVEYAPVAVQQQVRLLLLPETLGVAAHRYDGARRRKFCAEGGIGQRKPGALHRYSGYLREGREDKAAGHGPLPINVYVLEVALQQFPELRDVHLVPPSDASAVALVGVGLLIRGRDDEHPVLPQDSLDLPHQIFRMLQIFDYPEGNDDIEVAFGIR
jgi:hypothetical protein